MNLQQLLLVVWARRRIAFLVMLLAVAATAAVSLLLPKQYVAIAELVFDFRADPIAGALQPGMGLPGYITTQMDIINSSRVATRAVRLLRLQQSPEAVERWRRATDGKVPLEIHYGRLLQNHLSIKPARGSNLIALSYAGSDPAFAAAAANAFAQAYVDVNVELRVEPARQYAAWFDERLKVLRADLERAQSKLSAYQQAKGIVASDERVDTETARLSALTAQLAETEGEKAASASRERNSGNELSPDVMENPIILGIKAETAKSEARLSELGSNIGHNHPQYRQLEAQIGGLRRQLVAEIRRISGSAATASRVTLQKEEELKAVIAAQKRSVLELRAERDAIAILARDVESAQHAYDAVAQRISMTHLESQMQQNNVGILSPAIEPDVPARPRVGVNILAALILGSLLGIGAALVREQGDRRIRGREDMALPAPIPVIAVLQPPAPALTWRRALELGRAGLRRLRARVRRH